MSADFIDRVLSPLDFVCDVSNDVIGLAPDDLNFGYIR